MAVNTALKNMCGSNGNLKDSSKGCHPRKRKNGSKNLSEFHPRSERTVNNDRSRSGRASMDPTS